MSREKVVTFNLRYWYLFILLVLAISLGYLFTTFDTLGGFLDQETMSKTVVQTGIWSPLTFVVFQVVQVFIAPLPGQVTGLVGGYLFGVWLGTFLTTIGALLGFLLILVITRKFGRPFIQKFVNQELLYRFDSFSEKKGTFSFFVLFLLPAFPDDVLCFVAGLTKIPILKLLLVSVIGRLPGYFVLSYMGDMGGRGSYLEVGIVATFVFILSISLYYYHEKIENTLNRFA